MFFGSIVVSLLLEGLGWRVGNGLNIRVWIDKWVPNDGGLTVPISSSNNQPDLLVSDLIDFDSGNWNRSTLEILFDDATAAGILSIPLSNRWPIDLLFWWNEKNGCYSVKSGYRLGLLGHTNDADNPTTAGSKFWSSVWNIEGPPKLKHFLWRACKGSLATKHSLFQRYCVPSSLCDRCRNEPESVVHAILDCPKVQPMWSPHPDYNLLQDAPRSSFADLFLWVLGHVAKDSLSSILTTLWAAWYFRNKQIFEGFDGDPMMLARSFNNVVEEYKRYNGSTSVLQQPRFIHNRAWQPPLNGWVKVNFDAYIAHTALRGLGVVVRDSRGKLLMAAVRRIKCRWPVDVSEAAAALFGIQAAVRLGYHNIHLEGDSLSVVAAINHRLEGRSPIHLIYDSISDLCMNVSEFVCSFVRRDGNSLAHLVARWDTGLADEKICMEPFPQGLQSLADIDLC